MVDVGIHHQFTKLPSYLKELLKRDEDICLVYNKRLKSLSVRDQSHVSSISLDSRNDCDSSNIDLTGCPLKVDLDDDQLSTTLLLDRPSNWTDEEMQHIPVTLSQARKFINSYNKKKASGDALPPVYCVCDGSDPKITVILGANISDAVFMHCQVFIVGIFPFGHHNLSVQYMNEKHLKNVGVADVNVRYKVTSHFGIYGYNLSNCPTFVNIENRGSILAEVSWNSCSYEIPNAKVDYKITLQTILGHADSQASILWEDLNLLEYFIRLSKKRCLETDVLNVYGDSLETITDLIYDALNNEYYTVKPRPENQQRKSLNLQHLRQANILDDLWNHLKKCETVSNLRSCLHNVFEHVAEETTKLYIPEDNESMFATIIRGIYSGKTAVPTLTFHQALELVVELGLEKLKDNYLTLINHFCSFPKRALITDWNFSKLSSSGAPKGANTKVSVKSECLRKTRMTFDFGANENVELYSARLKHLARMHAVVEFFLLVEDQTGFLPETYQYIGRCACNKYMTPTSPIQDFSALQANRLCDLTLTVNCIDESVIKDKTPIKWHMEMSSKYNCSEVTTIFFHAESAIFPTVIFNNYDLSFSDANKKLYYVTELVQYKQLLK